MFLIKKEADLTFTFINIIDSFIQSNLQMRNTASDSSAWESDFSGLSI